MIKEEGSIADVIDGCRRWDRNSQKLLYSNYYEYGMSICMRYSENREEAAGIFNDAFLKIFKSIDKFNITQPFKPWLRKIIVNTAIDHYHSKQKQMNTEAIENIENKAGDESILSGITYQEVVELLHKLSPAYRTVFNLHVIEGYSHEDIGKMLNISAGTSKSNLHKAKEQLRKILTNFLLK